MTQPLELYGLKRSEQSTNEIELIQTFSHKDATNILSSASSQHEIDSAAGASMVHLIEELYPICRSITGDGVRQTLRILQQHIPLHLCEVPSGSQVFDWTVPKEWNIRDAYVKNSQGERVIDFHKSNLHVVNYSVPVHGKMGLAQLKKHLFALPDRPDWIPYRTTYYQESWGFCVSQQQLEALREDEYEVCIDSSLENGSLTYGELFVPGETSEEVLISSHICHPSLCNDNLSGIATAVWLAKQLKTSNKPRHYSYRFLLIPGTIGAISWLALNEDKIANIKHGLVLTGLGDAGKLHYKKSRRGNAEIDRAVSQILKEREVAHELLDFSPYGYDERQYCSPGIDLPVGRLSRTPHGTFPEYHTSADNLDFISAEKLGESLSVCSDVLFLLENNGVFLNLNPKGEPQLGKRGLYRIVGGQANLGFSEMAMLWVLNLSDGKHSLLDVAERSGIPFHELSRAARTLEEHRLLRKRNFAPAAARGAVGME
jgi:aminopeptidase-like protein